MTEPVKRYRMVCEDQDDGYSDYKAVLKLDQKKGNIVKHSDYARLEQERDGLRKALQKMTDHFGDPFQMSRAALAQGPKV